MVVAADRLTDRDREVLARLRIAPEILAAAQVRRIDDTDARHLLALNGRPGHFAGIEFPYLDPERGHRTTLRVRLDRPPIDTAGKPQGKYRQPPGDQRHVYFPPGAGSLLADRTVPVVISESEKATLALASLAQRTGRPLLPIGLGGCWNWRGRIGKDTDPNGARVDVVGPLPDFLRLKWNGRVVLVLFDARPNDSVKAARRQLAHYLTSLGAQVQHVHLPDDDPANGPDDYLGRHGDAAMLVLLDAAVPHDFTRHLKTGAVLTGDLDNIRLALSRLEVQPTFDQFRRVVCLNGAPITDAQLEQVWVRISDACGFRPSLEVLRRVVLAEANEHPVHPVRHYLEGLSWDGVPRLDRWLVTYAGADDTEYVRAVGALPLLAAVRRVRQPGAKFDELLILEGPQGGGKSSALAALCPAPEWFTDDLPLGVDSKQTIERTSGRWIVEAAELHGHSGREADALKQFLSRGTDGPCRMAYERFAVAVPRQFVQIGTTNAHSGYLKDHTGARRFWPVRVTRFDVAALARDRDQLWAEAAYREAGGASIRLDERLWSRAATAQDERREIDPWEELLEPLFTGDGVTAPERIASAAVWQVLSAAAIQQDNRHAARVAKIAQRFGFIKRRARLNGTNVQCWVRLDAPAEDEA